MLQSLHQSVELLRAAALCCKLFQPFAEHSIERLVLRFGQQARLLYQLLIGTQGDVFHTETVYTIFVSLASATSRCRAPKTQSDPIDDFLQDDISGRIRTCGQNKWNAQLFGEERVAVGFEDQWIDKNGQRHFSQMAWINKRPTTSITEQVTPSMENVRDFDPPDPRLIDHLAKRDDGINE
jgi:hypothetical protein